MRPRIETPLEIRFWSKVDIRRPGECWPWIAGNFPDGYGCFYLDGRMHGAHRIAWRLARGKIPRGKHALHHCDNPPCCNPYGKSHIYVGNHQQNMRDMYARSRRRPARGNANGARTRPDRLARGDNHYRAKLTADQVRTIRGCLDRGAKQSELARRFGVTRSLIHHIKTRLTWAHL